MIDCILLSADIHGQSVYTCLTALSIVENEGKEYTLHLGFAGLLLSVKLLEDFGWNCLEEIRRFLPEEDVKIIRKLEYSLLSKVKIPRTVKFMITFSEKDLHPYFSELFYLSYERLPTTTNIFVLILAWKLLYKRLRVVAARRYFFRKMVTDL